MEIRHRWETSRMVEVVVGDDPDAWRAAGFTVTDDVAVIAGVEFRLAGADSDRGVHGCTVEADTPAAADRGIYTINGFTWQVQALGIVGNSSASSGFVPSEISQTSKNVSLSSSGSQSLCRRSRS